MSRFFALEAQDSNSKARAGRILTAHGEIETPIFMPVGTQGTVKTLTQAQVSDDVKAQIILGNTYHLYLRPGLSTLEQAGGLHKFMHWQKPILTDSGGYQVYSLAQNRKIKPEGVTFASHIDGSKHLFTPENVVDKQRSIGSDIQMVLDECPPYPCEYAYAKKSMKLTHDWAKRAREYFLKAEPLYGFKQHQFGIVQGSVFHDLRDESTDAIVDLDFEGNAIGGLAVGEPNEEMYELTERVCNRLPADKPRYLMGVGTPANILTSIGLGVDMMDCVMPSRNARHGLLFYWDGVRNIKNAKYKDDFSPIDETADCPTDLLHTKAYLRHLFVADEFLAQTLATIHNLNFYLRLVKTAREKIISGEFFHWSRAVLPNLTNRL